MKVTIVAVAAMLGGGVVAAAPAQAEGSRVECSQLSNGELCLHVWGNVGERGTIGVSYRKDAGEQINGALSWTHRDPHEILWIDAVWSGYMSAGSTYSGHSESVHEAGHCYHGTLAGSAGHFDTPQICF